MSLHPYSYNLGSENEESVKVAFRLALFSVLCTALIFLIYSTDAVQDRLAAWTPSKWVVGFVFSTPTALGLLAWTYKKTSESWWTSRFVRWCLDISVPNLNGTWTGRCVTYYPNHERHDRPARLVIWQDMRHIGLCIDSQLHKIDSVGASIRRVADGWIVSFHYCALRKLKHQCDLDAPWNGEDRRIRLECGTDSNKFERDFLAHHSHVGCARLYFPDPARWPESTSCDYVKIQFYTDNQRIGFMELRRESTPSFPVDNPPDPGQFQPGDDFPI